MGYVRTHKPPGSVTRLNKERHRRRKLGARHLRRQAEALARKAEKHSLDKVSTEWKSNVGSSTSIEWPVGIGAIGNEGVSNTAVGAMIGVTMATMAAGNAEGAICKAEGRRDDE
jgi:hypothetical protein